ncbi:hypothetical protein [Snodgrassella alvi]|jgi:hypothetical protein|nr:hypothetical protein [Snodgrassella alvi]
MGQGIRFRIRAAEGEAQCFAIDMQARLSGVVLNLRKVDTVMAG